MTSPDEDELDLATLDITSPEHYEKNGYPHREWTYLRRHAPVFWYDRPNVDPFWAITKHADIIELSKQPTRFLNEPRIAVFPNNIPPPEERSVRHLLNMDPPDHGKYRRVSSMQFTPRAVRGLQEKVERITREVLDEAAQLETCDFVQNVSAPITIAVIAEMLGVPRPIARCCSTGPTRSSRRPIRSFSAPAASRRPSRNRGSSSFRTSMISQRNAG